MIPIYYDVINYSYSFWILVNCRTPGGSAILLHKLNYIRTAVIDQYIYLG